MTDGTGRTVSDELGELTVPADAYWGAHTQRAIENVGIGGRSFGRRFVGALGTVKKAAALANRDLGHLSADVAAAIVVAADEVAHGRHDDQFPVGVFQTGSGTSTNMNANEVIATRATELLDGEATVHPNDHVNFGQSSNDVIPTAMHVAARVAADGELRPALGTLLAELAAKRDAFDDVVKTGRTHLQDALPIRLGQEFSGYVAQIEAGIERVETAFEGMAALPLGGHQVGTGMNCPEGFPARAIAYIAEETGIPFREADDHFAAQAAHDAVSEAHGALRTLAGSLHKIANDLRLLASGPRAGLGEIEQPKNQPGSSITPGKINPVVAEAVNQVYVAVLGNDTTVAVGAAAGELEINLYKPVLATRLLESIESLAGAAETFAESFVARLDVDRERCARQVERGIALATALSPHIGHERTAEVATTAIEEGRTVRSVVVEKGYLSPDAADRILDPARMTERGIPDAK